MHFLSKEIIPGRAQYIMVSSTCDALMVGEHVLLVHCCCHAIPCFRRFVLRTSSKPPTGVHQSYWSSPQEQGVPEGVIYGLSVIAALIAVELVIMVVLNLVLYLQRRKHKVVFLKVRPSWWCSCQLNDCTISVVSIHHWWLLLPPVLPPSTNSSFAFHCAGYWSRVVHW